MKLNTLFKSLAAAACLLPAVAYSQITVFSTDFASDSLNQASFTPTSNSTAWNIASTKNATSSVGSGALELDLPSTSSGFLEAQTNFATSPVSLTTAADYLEVTTTFTATSNVLTGGVGSQLFIGLFNAGGVNPATGLQSSGLSTAEDSPFATGGAQTWQGFNAAVSFTGGNSAIRTRAPQNVANATTGAGSASNNQELLFQGGGGSYVNPGGVNLTTSNADAATATLIDGDIYTLTLRATLTDLTTLTLEYNLYSGGTATGTAIATLSTTATGANLLTTSFDSLAIGYRYSNTATASSITYSSLAVTTNVVPEPGTFAMLLAGLGMLGFLRRGRRSCKA